MKNKERIPRIPDQFPLEYCLFKIPSTPATTNKILPSAFKFYTHRRAALFCTRYWLLWLKSAEEQTGGQALGVQLPFGYRKPNTTPQNSASTSVIFLKNDYVFSLMPRSLRQFWTSPFSLLVPFSVSGDCSSRWLISLDATEDYFNSQHFAFVNPYCSRKHPQTCCSFLHFTHFSMFFHFWFLFVFLGQGRFVWFLLYFLCSSSQGYTLQGYWLRTWAFFLNYLSSNSLWPVFF